MNPLRRTPTIALLATLAVAGCSDESTGPGNDGPQAPPLPPAATLQFDTSFFEDTQARGSEADQSRFHWLNAVVRVTAVNLLVTEALHAPHLAFALAIHTVPSYLGDDTFLWVYTWVDPDGREVEVRLQAHVFENAVEWEVRVSDTNPELPLDEVLWFRGASNHDATAGFWVFQDVENNPEDEVARIDYVVTAENQAELSFSIVQASHLDFGDTLTYSVSGDIITIEWVDASEAITADVTWDDVVGDGSLMAPDYNNGERACWDENQYDTACGIGT